MGEQEERTMYELVVKDEYGHWASDRLGPEAHTFASVKDAVTNLASMCEAIPEWAEGTYRVLDDLGRDTIGDIYGVDAREIAESMRARHE